MDAEYWNKHFDAGLPPPPSPFYCPGSPEYFIDGFKLDVEAKMPIVVQQAKPKRPTRQARLKDWHDGPARHRL